MTQGAFIEHLLYNECEIDREVPKDVYRIKNRNNKLTSVMSHWDRSKKMKAMSICQICHTLDIPLPDEVRHVEEDFKKIKQSFETISQKIKPK